jgi:hypothetical protein
MIIKQKGKEKKTKKYLNRMNSSVHIKIHHEIPKKPRAILQMAATKKNRNYIDNLLIFNL